MTTLAQWLRVARAQLETTSPTPEQDARALASYALERSRAQLIAADELVLDATAHTRLEALLARRRNGEPIAYITRGREFWSLPLEVTPAVLIPRPDTELLVERALAQLAASPGETPMHVCDLGTGSGAIALALAQSRANLAVFATDVSAAALDIAQRNARALGLTVSFVRADWLAPFAPQSFDMIVSNPPYVRDQDPHLQQDDVRFEPRLALCGGFDGLDAYRDILTRAAICLRPGGWLLFEHGYDQAASVQDLLHAAGFDRIGTARDLTGHERVTAARWPTHA